MVPELHLFIPIQFSKTKPNTKLNSVFFVKPWWKWHIIKPKENELPVCQQSIAHLLNHKQGRQILVIYNARKHFPSSGMNRSYTPDKDSQSESEKKEK